MEGGLYCPPPVFACSLSHARSMTLPPNRSTANATSSPMQAAPTMSLGKCTKRYMRENAINAANGIAMYPNLRFADVSIAAAMVDDSVCPDGNE